MVTVAGVILQPMLVSEMGIYMGKVGCSGGRYNLGNVGMSMAWMYAYGFGY